MIIAVLSGARKNAGDYLITERSEKLLLSRFKGSSIHEFPINEPLDNRIEDLNKCDLIVVPGGPIMKNEYPDAVPLVKDLSLIKKPMVGIGLGWYGNSACVDDIYKYNYTQKTIEYIRKLSINNSISCRDWYTVWTLKNNGIINPIMTGCPAWYDMAFVGETTYRTSISIPYKRISISDPAKRQNRKYIIPIVSLLKQLYPDAEITYVYHRGLSQKGLKEEIRPYSSTKINEELKAFGVKILDISSSAEGLSVYDQTDLHIGFRVHAHIYCLSHRGLSILIEEDGRGAGVNNALALQGIKAYIERASTRIRFLETTESVDYLINCLKDNIYRMETTEYKEIKHAYSLMIDSYEKMLSYINLIEQII